MTIALHYTHTRKPPEPGQIYGAQVAILEWLRAYLRYSSQERLNFLIGDEASWLEIQDIAREEGVDPKRLVPLDSRFPRENLAGIDTVFRADPDPHHLLWQRNLLPSPGFSFSGLIHTISGLESERFLAEYCLAPSTGTDALFCPSQSVVSCVRRFWDHYSTYLAERFGAKYTCPLQLPVLPHGVDVERMAASMTPEVRARQREALGFGADDIVVFWVGRLSHAIKAHPLAMFQAVELAARRTKKKVRFLMQGYFVPQQAGPSYRALAAEICKTAEVTFVSTDDPRFPDRLWPVADIFLSLVDNLQESFGLTPIEAMAAGVPRVVSDWDGYRDGVTHGVDGFLVPTTQPPAGAGDELAMLQLGGRESFGGFHAIAAQCTAVDQFAAADFLYDLIENPDLRARISAKGKERLAHYRWDKIIPRYEEIWADLAARRAPRTSLSTIHPLSPDPFSMFEEHPTAPLKEADKIALVANPQEIQRLLAHEINTLAARVLLSTGNLTQIFQVLGRQDSLTVRDALALFETNEHGRVQRSIVWLTKLGIVRLTRSS